MNLCNFTSILATTALGLSLSSAPVQAGGPLLLLIPLLKGGATAGAVKGGAAVGATKGGAAIATTKGGTALTTGSSGIAAGGSKGYATVYASKPSAIATKSFSYGSMTIAGAAIVGAVASAGYAMPASEVEQDMLADDMTKKRSKGATSYRPIECIDPNGVSRAMPEYYTSCPWGTSARPGQNLIDLARI